MRNRGDSSENEFYFESLESADKSPYDVNNPARRSARICPQEFIEVVLRDYFNSSRNIKIPSSDYVGGAKRAIKELLLLKMNLGLIIL